VCNLAVVAMKHFAHDSASTIARSIPREPGRSDLYRTVVVRLAQADYEATAPLFLSIRRDLEGRG
jgi:hypothetical protein